MKRFISLALALCLSLTMITFSAEAITAGELNKKGTVNIPLAITEADFAGACTGINGSIKSITIISTPTSIEGQLYAGGVLVGSGTVIPAASLSSLVFNPSEDFIDVATFTWSAEDTSGAATASADANLDFTVARPIVTDQTIKMLVNTPASGTLNADDPQGLPLTYAIITGPKNGDITFSVSRGTFTYTPDNNFVGTETITFTASNEYKTSLPGTVTFIVGNVTAPTAEDMSIDVGMRGTVSSVLSAEDTNATPFSLTYSIVTQPKKGKITYFNEDTGDFVYQHNTDKLVTDTFTFRVNNGYLYSNTATVTINIKTPAPLAYRDLKDHWAKMSAGTLGVLDIVIGEQIQNMYYYYPNRAVTRAEFARFLNAIAEIPLSSTPTSVFADVTEPFMIESLNASYAHGITAGTVVNGKTYFYPGKAITRIEAMKMMDNAMKFTNQSSAPLTFRDNALVPDWAEQAVQNLVGYKIVKGSDGYLRPLDLITRAEAAEMLFLAYLERKN